MVRTRNANQSRWADIRPRDRSEMFKLMLSFRRTITLLAAAGALAIWAVPGRADDKNFKIVVAAILASEKSYTFDRRQKDLPDKVKGTEPKLKGFRVGAHSHKTLAIDQSWAFPLVEDQVVKISVAKAPKDKDNVVLRISPPQMGEII